MALTPARMKRVDAVILEKDVRQVTTLLGRLGMLHLVEVRPEDAAAPLQRRASRDDLERVEQLLARVDAVLEQAGRPEVPTPATDSHETLETVEARVAALEKTVSEAAAERARLAAESEQIQDELLRINAIGSVTVPLARLLDSPFLHFAIGTIRASDLKRLRETARAGTLLLEGPEIGDRMRLIAVSSRKGRFALETLLKEHGFTWLDLGDLPKGVPVEIMVALERRLDAIRASHREAAERAEAMLRDRLPEAMALRHRLRLERAIIEAQRNFGHTSSTCVISGWLPEDTVALISRKLLEDTGGRVFLQVRSPQEAGVPDAEVPVLMKNGPIVRSFEMLVRGLGFPRYNEIEPTLLVAATFLVMYGMMFGDVGHGAALALVGLGLRWKGRDATMRDLGVIVTAAGAAAALGGFLYGSVFGLEVLRPLWLRPMDPEHPENILRLLGTPVAMGVVMISGGIVLNIVNKFRSGEYFHAILDRCGVVGMVFYWGALGLGIRAVVTGKSVTAWSVGLLVGVPLAILFFREPILGLLTRRRHAEGHGMGVLLHGGIDVMETLSSYLANTISFARVGAFALAHAGLCFAIFALQNAVRGLPAGALWSAVIFIGGNLLVLFLEGLIVFVQCLRLEYYEFFSKFFSGSGTGYKPFRIQ